MKLGLNDELDVYGFLRVVHNWLPLVLFMCVILSKVCTAQRTFILTASQVCGAHKWKLKVS